MIRRGMRNTMVAAGVTLALVLAGLPAAPLQAAAPGTVAGQVTSAVGQPLARVPVTLFPAANARPAGAAMRTEVTDASGGWAFSGLTPGDYYVRLTIGRHVIGEPVTISAAEGRDGVLLLAPSAALLQGQAAAAAGAWWTSQAALVGIVGGAIAATTTVLVVRDAS